MPLPFKGNPNGHIHSSFMVTPFPRNAFNSGRQAAKTKRNALRTTSLVVYVKGKKRHEDQVTHSPDPCICFPTDPLETLHNLQVLL